MCRTKRICDKGLCKEGIRDIKKFASWNGFPRIVSNKLIDRFVKSSNTNNKNNNTKLTEKEKYVYFELPYIGPIGENLVKQFKKKMKRFLNPSKKVNIKTLFKTTHLSVFASTKDKVPPLSKSHAVYEVKCPGCGIQYIGKTDRTLHERTRERAWSDVESPLRNHLSTCEHFLHTYELLSMPDTTPPMTFPGMTLHLYANFQ